MQEKVWHGYYQASSEDWVGALLYSTPSGKTVKVTKVCATRDEEAELLAHGAVYVGEVTRMVKRVTAGQHETEFPVAQRMNRNHSRK